MSKSARCGQPHAACDCKVISVARHADYFTIFQVTFSPDEAVEDFVAAQVVPALCLGGTGSRQAIYPPPDTIWTCGAGQAGGKGGSMRPSLPADSNTQAAEHGTLPRA